MMAKPVVWVAVAFATAGAVASRQPAEGSGQQEAVVLSAEIDGGEDAGVIQLTAAEAPATGAVLEERPVEKPLIEERRMKKLAANVVIERPVAQGEVMEKMMELQERMLVLQRQRVAKLKQAAKRLSTGEGPGEMQSREFQLDAEIMQAEVQAMQLELQTLQLQKSQSQVLNAQNAVMNTRQPVEVRMPLNSSELSPGELIRMEVVLLNKDGTRRSSNHFPSGFAEHVIEEGGTIVLGAQYGRVKIAGVDVEEAAKRVKIGLAQQLDPELNVKVQIVKVRQPTLPGEFPVPTPAQVQKWWQDVPPALVSDKLSPGQTIQVEIYTETASADLMNGPEPMGRGGMMGGGMEELPAVATNSTRTFTIEPMGTIAFGAKYGRVKVAGMTLEAAEQAIAEMLREQAPDVKVQITLPEPLSAEVIRGRKYEAERAANDNAPSIFCAEKCARKVV